MPRYFLALIDWLRTLIVLYSKRPNFLFNEGEIWWCSIGMNVGVEIYGKGREFTRPVIVFKKFGANSFLGIPLTTQEREGSWYAPITYGGEERRTILNQIRVLDAKRLKEKIGALGTGNFRDLSERFLMFYGPKKIVTPPNEAGFGG